MAAPGTANRLHAWVPYLGTGVISWKGCRGGRTERVGPQPGQTGAWMGPVGKRRRADNRRSLPVVYTVLPAFRSLVAAVGELGSPGQPSAPTSRRNGRHAFPPRLHGVGSSKGRMTARPEQSLRPTFFQNVGPPFERVAPQTGPAARLAFTPSVIPIRSLKLAQPPPGQKYRGARPSHGLADVSCKRSRNVAELLEVNTVNSQLAGLGHLDQQQGKHFTQRRSVEQWTSVTNSIGCAIFVASNQIWQWNMAHLSPRQQNCGVAR